MFSQKDFFKSHTRLLEIMDCKLVYNMIRRGSRSTAQKYGGERILYYIRKFHNDSTLLFNDFTEPLDPSTIIGFYDFNRDTRASKTTP